MVIKNLVEQLEFVSQAHAKWEIENARTIIKSRKRLAILAAMLIPIIVLPITIYAEGLPTLLGGEEAYGPAYSTTKLFFVSIFIGLCAGLITGVIGAGGGFVITPALMSMGVRGILAVGTDLFHIFAKAIMGTILHGKLGNVSVRLALAFVVGSIPGATVGGTINRTLYNIDPMLSDAFISVVYVLLLGTLGFYALYDVLRLRKKTSGETEEKKEGAVATTGVAKKLQSINVPPMITFDETVVPGGRKISGFFVAGCGFIVGVAAAIMGVGGGFLTFPMFVYTLGISSFTTIGTDIFQIVITAGYASIFQYAVHGFIFYTLAMGLLVGSIFGIQVGAFTTKIVKGLVIRAFYATVVLAGFTNRLLALPAQLNALGTISISPSLASGLNTAGIVIFFAIISFFAIWVMYMFFTNIKVLKAEA